MTEYPVCNKKTQPPPLPTQASHPQRFSVLVAKYALQNGIELDDDCFAGNEGDECDIDTFDNDSDDSDDEVHP